MSDNTHNAPHAMMSLGDVYFVLFRHKWKILICSAMGFLAAAAIYLFMFPPAYQSDTEIYIRYVEEGKPLSSPGNDANATLPEGGGYGIIQTEVAILQSLDVAAAAVQNIGADKILAKAGGGSDTNKAAGLINKNLTIESLPGSSVIQVSFRHPDQQIVQPVLNAIIDSYYKKHAQIHQGGVVFNDFLVQETNRLRAELTQTEEDLRKAKDKVGVISVDDAKRGYEEQISQIREELFTAQAELAEHEGMLKETTGVSPSALQTTSTPKATNAEAQISPAEIDQYNNVCIRLDFLKKREDEFLLQGYTEENVLVQGVRTQIAQNEVLKKKLEQEEPRLAELAVTLPTTIGQQTDHSLFNATDESAQIAAFNAKIKVLNLQLVQVQAQAVALDAVAATISELERKGQSEEANLEYFSHNLEQSRIDEILGEGKSPNIGIIQSPSPPVRERPKFVKKVVLAVAFAGFAGGLALAFFIELIWDRSVKRPEDVKTKLRLPLFITIPDMSQNGHRHLLKATGKNLLPLKGADAGKKAMPHEITVAQWDRNHPLRRFCEGLRNRLIVYFEVKKIKHSPKLVAVTSCGKGAGVSGIAAGLAASLSETGDGNVLLVSISGDQGATQQFHKGELGCGLADALEADTKKSALIEGNLYRVTERADNHNLVSALPKRLTSLMPKLKASDYDYIIFDLPPVTQTSVTPRLSGLMDMVLLVIESEKTNQDIVKGATQLLAESGANVSIVLNKARTYVPANLSRELLDHV
jgi:succinoglycan biosynthesis transport protein ExoP